MLLTPGFSRQNWISGTDPPAGFRRFLRIRSFPDRRMPLNWLPRWGR